MRKIFIAGAAIAGFIATGALVPTSAGAMTISTPAAAAQAVGESNVTDVAYRCRRVWTRWGWRRSCVRRPAPYVRYGYPGYYGGPYAYYGWRRPYYRRYWW